MEQHGRKNLGQPLSRLSSSSSSSSSWHLLLLLLVLLVLLDLTTTITTHSIRGGDSSSSSSSSLMKKNGKNHYYLASPGETYPQVVEVAIGDDFNVTCIMNPLAFPGKNSSNLYFVYANSNDNDNANDANGNGDNNANDDRDDVGKLLPMENLYILNETTIIYRVENASEQRGEYRCKCDDDAIMESKVYVGYPPLPIQDFHCLSYDLEYMMCNFTRPSNPILTQYNVSFYMDTMKEYLYRPECNFNTIVRGGDDLIICNISLTNNYRPRVEIYHYIIDGRNTLAEMSAQHFLIMNWEIMIPSRPGQDLHIESVNDHSLVIRWRMTKWDEYRSRGLEWDIQVIDMGNHNNNNNNLNRTIIITNQPERYHGYLRLICDHLPFANWPYELQMRVRLSSTTSSSSSSSSRDENYWSDVFRLPFMTGERKPDRPPLMTKGSFYIDAMETQVTIYWEQLDIHEYNGANFQYVIEATATNGDENFILKPIQHDLNLAIFVWDKRLRYDFRLRSNNRLGNSLESSQLIIPAFWKRNVKHFIPRSIHNVYHADNRTYYLTWHQPEVIQDLLNYTVYWCVPKRALPNECKGPIHFEQLSGNQLSYTTRPQNVLQEQTMNLAVSADYKDFNGGLYWTACTMDVNSDLVKMDPDVVANSPYTLLVQWSVDRICTSILEGFHLSYCETKTTKERENTTTTSNNQLNQMMMMMMVNDNDDNDDDCLPQTIRNVNISKHLKKYEISHLKPYTGYRLQIYMYSRFKTGQRSDVLYVRTQETAPMPPRQLQVIEITNSSATITWMPPIQTNGRIRQYIISLNNGRVLVDAETFRYQFQDLECFTSYKVYVVAQGIESSAPSNDVHFTTLIGVPSPPGHTSSSGLNLNNNNNNMIEWSKPLQPRGRIDYYEVAITQLRYNELQRQRITLIMGDVTSCTFRPPICLGPEYKTIVEVRAVNVAPDIDRMDVNALRKKQLQHYHHQRDRNHYIFTNLWKNTNENENDDENPYNFNGNEDLSCLETKLPSASSPPTTTTQIIPIFRKREAIATSFNDSAEATATSTSMTSSSYRLYKSPWNSIETYSCSTSRISRMTLVALTIIAMLVGILTMLYLAGKKYNKMANINCTLPAGLDSYFSKDTTMGNVFGTTGNNNNNTTNINITPITTTTNNNNNPSTNKNRERERELERILNYPHSKLSNDDEDDDEVDDDHHHHSSSHKMGNWFQHRVNNRFPGTINSSYQFRNEHDNLLDSIGQDSGYGRLEPYQSLSTDNTSISLNKSSFENHPENPHRLMQRDRDGDRNEEEEEFNDYVVNDDDGGGGTENGYMMDFRQRLPSSQSTAIVSSPTSGYITVESLTAASQQQQQQPNSIPRRMEDDGRGGGCGGNRGGYTPIQSLIPLTDDDDELHPSIPIKRIIEHEKISTSPPPSMEEQLISGYVTQYDLNAFAKQQQQHKQHKGAESGQGHDSRFSSPSSI